LVVLDRDYFAVPENEIADVESMLTLLQNVRDALAANERKKVAVSGRKSAIRPSPSRR
jgi:hypothetical protein